MQESISSDLLFATSPLIDTAFYMLDLAGPMAEEYDSDYMPGVRSTADCTPPTQRRMAAKATQPLVGAIRKKKCGPGGELYFMEKLSVALASDEMPSIRWGKKTDRIVIASMAQLCREWNEQFHRSIKQESLRSELRHHGFTQYLHESGKKMSSRQLRLGTVTKWSNPQFKRGMTAAEVHELRRINTVAGRKRRCLYRRLTPRS